MATTDPPIEVPKEAGWSDVDGLFPTNYPHFSPSVDKENTFNKVFCVLLCLVVIFPTFCVVLKFVNF
jgi:hypothetical protein